MSTKRTILNSLAERQHEIEAAIAVKNEELAELKRELRRLKKAQGVLSDDRDERADGSAPDDTQTERTNPLLKETQR
jgi:hypothetical protein